MISLNQKVLDLVAKCKEHIDGGESFHSFRIKIGLSDRRWRDLLDNCPELLDANDYYKEKKGIKQNRVYYRLKKE